MFILSGKSQGKQTAKVHMNINCHALFFTKWWFKLLTNDCECELYQFADSIFT